MYKIQVKNIQIKKIQNIIKDSSDIVVDRVVIGIYNHNLWLQQVYKCKTTENKTTPVA